MLFGYGKQLNTYVKLLGTTNITTLDALVKLNAKLVSTLLDSKVTMDVIYFMTKSDLLLRKREDLGTIQERMVYIEQRLLDAQSDFSKCRAEDVLRVFLSDPQVEPSPLDEWSLGVRDVKTLEKIVVELTEKCGISLVSSRLTTIHRDVTIYVCNNLAPVYIHLIPVIYFVDPRFLHSDDLLTSISSKKFQKTLVLLSSARYDICSTIKDIDTTLFILKSHAEVLRYTRQFGECEKVFNRLLDLILRKHNGFKTGEYYTSLRRRAALFFTMKDSHKFFEIYKECYEWNINNRPNHPETIESMFDYASCIDEKGEHKEALRLYEECIVKNESLYGYYHSNNLLVLKNYALCLIDLQKHQEGMTLLTEVYYAQKDTHGPISPKTLDTLKMLVYLSKENKNDKTTFEFLNEAAGAYDLDLRTRQYSGFENNVKLYNKLREKYKR